MWYNSAQEGSVTIISAKEAMRSQATRLEVYKQAVQNGFYNEGTGTIGYKGFQIVPDGRNFHVFHKGYRLITLGQQHVAKVWITCRVSSLSLAEAYALVRRETD